MSDNEKSCPVKTKTKIITNYIYADSKESVEVKNRKTFFMNEEIDKEEFYNTLYKVLLVILLIAYIVMSVF
jgi:hypothetical protein